MRAITDIREQLVAVVARVDGVKRARAQLGPTEYANDGTNFIVTVIVGPPTPENEKIVDALYEDVRDAVNTCSLNAYTHRCSGHRLYAQDPASDPEMGCEWVVKVLT